MIQYNYKIRKGFDTMTDFSYEIKQHIATISQRGAWTLELNLISWGGRAPTYDLRKWSADHSKMSKGISLTQDELNQLINVLTPSAE